MHLYSKNCKREILNYITSYYHLYVNYYIIIQIKNFPNYIMSISLINVYISASFFRNIRFIPDNYLQFFISHSLYIKKRIYKERWIYEAGQEVENGRKRGRAKTKADREGRCGDTHLRAWDRVYAGVEVTSTIREVAATREREREISRTRQSRRDA